MCGYSLVVTKMSHDSQLSKHKLEKYPQPEIFDCENVTNYLEFFAAKSALLCG